MLASFECPLISLNNILWVLVTSFISWQCSRGECQWVLSSLESTLLCSQHQGNVKHDTSCRFCLHFYLCTLLDWQCSYLVLLCINFYYKWMLNFINSLSYCLIFPLYFVNTLSCKLIWKKFKKTAIPGINTIWSRYTILLSLDWICWHFG
jgi:hypothetical protein